MSTPPLPREQFLVISALGANPMELTNVLCRAANENRCAVVSTRLTRHGACSALVLEVAGSWDAYVAMWRIDPLVNVMSADFIVLLVLLSAYLPIDMRRRGLTPNGGWELCIAIPLLGPAMYFALRPTLASVRSPAPAPPSVARPDSGTCSSRGR